MLNCSSHVSSAHASESPTVQKSVLLVAIQKEIQRHDFSYFVDEPPSVAQGGRGVVVAGCPACKKRVNTMTQFLDHLTNAAMPKLINRLSEVTNRCDKASVSDSGQVASVEDKDRLQ